MTDEELIIYLRRSAVSYSHPLWKAADRIEAQAAEIERLRAALHEADAAINAEDKTYFERLMRAWVCIRDAQTGGKA